MINFIKLTNSTCPVWSKRNRKELTTTDVAVYFYIISNPKTSHYGIFKFEEESLFVMGVNFKEAVASFSHLRNQNLIDYYDDEEVLIVPYLIENLKLNNKNEVKGFDNYLKDLSLSERVSKGFRKGFERVNKGLFEFVLGVKKGFFDTQERVSPLPIKGFERVSKDIDIDIDIDLDIEQEREKELIPVKVGKKIDKIKKSNLDNKNFLPVAKQIVFEYVSFLKLEGHQSNSKSDNDALKMLGQSWFKNPAILQNYKSELIINCINNYFSIPQKRRMRIDNFFNDNAFLRYEKKIVAKEVGFSDDEFDKMAREVEARGFYGDVNNYNNQTRGIK